MTYEQLLGESLSTFHFVNSNGKKGLSERLKESIHTAVEQQLVVNDWSTVIPEAEIEELRSGLNRIITHAILNQEPCLENLIDPQYLSPGA